jgi:hypothetical protein
MSVPREAEGRRWHPESGLYQSPDRQSELADSVGAVLLPPAEQG